MTNRPHESELLSKGALLLLSQYGSMVVSIFFTFWLARLLGPSEFGRFAIGVFSFDIFNALTDGGWEQGVFFASHDNPDTAYATHLFVRVILGCIPLFVLLGALCVAPSLVVGGSKCIAVLLALAFWCEKASLTYKTILERTFALRRLAFFEMAALVASFVCALLSVYLGYGFLALPLQRLFEKIFVLLGYIFASPWKFSWHIDFGLIRSWIHSFGFVTWTGGLLSLFLYDFIGAFVGVSAGAHSGGLYARSFKMATLPLMVTTAFGRITTPLYAHSAGSKADIKKTFLTAQLAKVLLIIPAQVVLTLCAPWWIVRVLGEQWRAAVVLYQVLTVYGAVRAFYDDVPAVFVYGLRYPWIMIQQHLVQAFCMISTWFFLKNYCDGAFLGAVVMCGGILGVASWMWRQVFLALHVEWQDVVSAMRDILVRIGTIIAACYAMLVTPENADGSKKNSFDWRALFKL